jgi:hypothetical protein
VVSCHLGVFVLVSKDIVQLAAVLAVLGGVLTLVGGVLEMTGLLSDRRVPPLSVLANTIVFGTVLIVLGVVGLAGAMRMKTVVWSIVVVVVGFVAFQFGGGFSWWWGSWGPVLLIAGGIIGIIGDLV